MEIGERGLNGLFPGVFDEGCVGQVALVPQAVDNVLVVHDVEW